VLIPPIYMRRSGLASLLLLAGCPHAGGPGGSHGGRTPPDGLSIAIYTGTVTVQQQGGQPAPPPQFDMIETQQPITQPDGTVVQQASVALVDDRRTVTVDDDGTLALEQVAQGIELASLIVEPLDGHAFGIKSCARSSGVGTGLADHDATLRTSDGVTIDGRIKDTQREDGRWVVEDKQGRAHFVSSAYDEITLHDATAIDVRCEVDASPGPHRVRLAYATSDLWWAASYRVDVEGQGDDATAVVQPTYTIDGSGVIGARHATVSLLVGLPGGDQAPRAAWTGEVDLGNDSVAVQPAAHRIPAHLEYLYRGAITHKDDNPRIDYWRGTSTSDVFFAIGVAPDDVAANADLPGGSALFAVELPDGTTRQADGRWPDPDPEPGHGLDVKLWPSADLIGFRERKTPYSDGVHLVEQYLFSVSNQGAAPATVWVEEELRPGASWREVRKQWPDKPHQRGNLLRFKVDVAAGKIERLGFEAEYRWSS
jgi:hypothetical protein